VSSRDEVTCQARDLVSFRASVLRSWIEQGGEIRDRGELDDGESLWDTRVARESRAAGQWTVGSWPESERANHLRLRGGSQGWHV